MSLPRALRSKFSVLCVTGNWNANLWMGWVEDSKLRQSWTKLLGQILLKLQTGARIESAYGAGCEISPGKVGPETCMPVYAAKKISPETSVGRRMSVRKPVWEDESRSGNLNGTKKVQNTSIYINLDTALYV